jgi:hypothetical protein
MMVSPDFVRSKPKGRPILQEREPVMLSPAIEKLATARDAFDVRFILDQVPATIYAPLAVYIAARPGRFAPTVIAECVRIAGGERIRRMVGKQRTANLMQRYMRT